MNRIKERGEKTYKQFFSMFALGGKSNWIVCGGLTLLLLSSSASSGSAFILGLLAAHVKNDRTFF